MCKFDSDAQVRRHAKVVAAAILAAATVMGLAAGPAVAASPVPDAEAVALAAKHCTACHSAEPTHPAFARPPKGIKLDTIEGMRSWAKSIAIQVVIERAMPLGNETNMTEAERARLGAWAEGRE